MAQKRKGWQFNPTEIKRLLQAARPLPEEFAVELNSIDEGDSWVHLAVCLGVGAPDTALRVFKDGERSFLIRYKIPAKPGARQEYYHPEIVSEPEAIVLRQRFLLAVPRVLPEAAAELRGLVPRNAPDLAEREARKEWGQRFRRFMMEGGYRADFQAWLEKYNLSAPWMLEALERGFRLMLLWDNLVDTEKLDWLSMGVSPPLTPWQFNTRPDLLAVQFRDSWNPLEERRDAAEMRLRATFAAILQERLDAIEANMDELGFQKTKPRGELRGKARSTAKLDEHCEWLALYQCAGKSFEQIAEEYPAQKKGSPARRESLRPRDEAQRRVLAAINRRDTIQKASSELAGRLDLPLRS